MWGTINDLFWVGSRAFRWRIGGATLIPRPKMGHGSIYLLAAGQCAASQTTAYELA
jgi:hypothetical protein